MDILNNLLNASEILTNNVDLNKLITDPTAFTKITNSTVNINDSSRQIIINSLTNLIKNFSYHDPNNLKSTPFIDDSSGSIAENINTALINSHLSNCKLSLIQLGNLLNDMLNKKIGTLNNVFGTHILLSNDAENMNYNIFINSLLGVIIKFSNNTPNSTDLSKILNIPTYTPTDINNVDANKLLLEAKQLASV